MEDLNLEIEQLEKTIRSQGQDAVEAQVSHDKEIEQLNKFIELLEKKIMVIEGVKRRCDEERNREEDFVNELENEVVMATAYHTFHNFHNFHNFHTFP